MATILLVTFTNVANDPRVMRHIRALNSAFDVITCGKGPAPPGAMQHVQIPDGADHLPTTLRGLVGLAGRWTTYAYEHLPAASEVQRLAAALQFDAAIANDIAALPVTLRLAGPRPVVADLHEYAPREMEEDWRWRLMVQDFMTDLCRRYLTKAAAVTTVADGIGNEYRTKFGVEAVSVTNAAPWRRPVARPVGEPIRLVHSGIASPNRHLGELVSAAAGLETVTLDLYLVPSPRAKGHIAALRREASSATNVRVLDPVPIRSLPTTLDQYDVGVFVLEPVNFNYQWTLPNKFFNFVQSGLGAIIGPSPEMATLTRQYGLGRVLDDFREPTLRRALAELDPAQVRGWKQASCAAARDLSAEKQASRLVDVVQSVLPREVRP